MAQPDVHLTKDDNYRAVNLEEEETTDLNRTYFPSKQSRPKRVRHVTAPFAQDLGNLSNNTAQKLPPVNGPVSQYSIHHQGPLEVTWTKSLKFVNSIEGCDVQKVLNESFKIQGCYYILPRFAQFRVQLFEDKSNSDCPFVVELQRRDGDAFLTGLLFKSLRDFFREDGDNESGEMSIRDDSKIMPENNLPSVPTEFQGLDLTNGSEDVSHWVEMMNTTVLETTRSAANALALATQNEANIPFLLESVEGIATGTKGLLTYSKDPPTVFGCSVLLRALSVDKNFCAYCVENGVLLPILKALFDWSGQGRNDVSSTQILLHLTITLENIRREVDQESWFNSLRENSEAVDALETLLKNNNSGLGQRLFQVLFGDVSNSDNDVGEN